MGTTVKPHTRPVKRPAPAPAPAPARGTRANQGAGDRAPAGRRRALLVLLCAGFALRFWIAASTYNADGATLAWGSAFLAKGYTDPYEAVVRYSVHDPIPLDNIRSLSLAQGYVGVVAGAVPLWVGETLGLTHVGDPPDGDGFGLGELFAYKLSYLLPDLLILFCLARMFREDRRKRLLAILVWALNPVVFFAYGQGLPDLWVIAFLLMGYMAIRHAATGAPGARKVRAYVLAGGVVALGTFGTKLLPAPLMLPLIVFLVRERELSARQKATAGAAVGGLVLLCALPYLVSDFAWLNVFQRFEFFGRRVLKIPVSAGAPDAELAVVVVLGVTIWMALGSRPAERFDAWCVVTYVALAVFLGVLAHLVIWALFPLFVLVRRNERAVVVLGAGLALYTTWILFFHNWLSGIALRAFDKGLRTGDTYDFVRRSVPFEQLVGAAVVSLLVLGAGYAIVASVRGWDERVGRLRPLAVGAGVLAVVFALCLPVASLMAAEVGKATYDTEAAFTRAVQKAGGDTQEATLEFPRFTSWESEEVAVHRRVNRVLVTTHSETEPSLDELVVQVRRGRRVLARGSVPIWKAEPQSDRGSVHVALSRTVDLHGTRIRLERLPPGYRGGGGRAPEAVNRPLFRLPAVVEAGTENGVPILEFRHSVAGAAARELFGGLLSWQHLLLLPGLAIALGFLGLAVVRRGVGGERDREGASGGGRLRLRFPVSRG